MQLDLDECRRRAAHARFAVLATTSASGQVDLVPITFALTLSQGDDRLISAVDHKPKSTQQLARLANVIANPMVTLLFEHRDDSDWNQLWWVRARGVAAVREPGYHLELLVARYPQYQSVAPAGPVLEVALSTFQGWSAQP